ncbi:MAG: DMT family transporter [Patulibacter minatonensis]
MDRRAALLFAALGVAWGIPYLLVKVAIEELSPAALLLMRTALGAAILLPLAAWRRELAPTARRWRPILLYAGIEVVVPWLMIGTAEQRLPSSTTGLLVAATPLMGVLLAFASGRREVLGRSGWVGLLLGLAGVAALVGLDIHASDRIAVLQLMLVVTGYAIGPMILARALPDESAVAVMGLSFAAASVGALGVLAVGGGWPTQVPSANVLGAVAVLALVCTVGAFLLLFALIGLVGAVRSTAVTYINPAVAILVGAVFLDERITSWTLLGFFLVLAGSVLLARRPAAAIEERGPGEAAGALAGTAPAARATTSPVHRRRVPFGRPVLARRR